MSNFNKLITLLLFIAFLAPAPTAAGDAEAFGLAAAAIGLFAALANNGPEQFLISNTGVAAVPAFDQETTRTPGSALFSVFKYRELTAIRLLRGGVAYRVVADKPTFCRPDLTACWVDKNSDGILDVNKMNNLPAKVPYQQERLQLDLPESGFRYELLYQGVANGVVRLLYREFVDDMARPSFSQELTFEANTRPGESTKVAF